MGCAVEAVLWQRSGNGGLPSVCSGLTTPTWQTYCACRLGCSSLSVEVQIRGNALSIRSNLAEANLLLWFVSEKNKHSIRSGLAEANLWLWFMSVKSARSTSSGFAAHQI